jgi:excisionase family DNA binding protein
MLLHSSSMKRSEQQEAPMSRTQPVAGEPQAVWCSYEYAAKLTGLSRHTLWRAVKDGEIEAAKIGRAVRLKVESLERYMEARTVRIW